MKSGVKVMRKKLKERRNWGGGAKEKKICV